MKNVFFIINKEKLYAYIVSVFTIVILFFMSFTLNNEKFTKETSSELELNMNSNIQRIENSIVKQKDDRAVGEADLVSNNNLFIENSIK